MTYTVKINTYTIQNLLINRLDTWKDRLAQNRYDLIHDLIETNPDELINTENFDPDLIIDDLIINGQFITQNELKEDPSPDDIIHHHNNLYLLRY